MRDERRGRTRLEAQSTNIRKEEHGTYTSISRAPIETSPNSQGRASKNMIENTNDQELLTLQKEYSEAVAKKQTAKSRLEKLLKQQHDHEQNLQNQVLSHQQTRSGTAATTSSRHHKSLTQHLQNLRLQRQYDHLSTLAAHTKEFGQITERESLDDNDNFLPLVRDHQSQFGNSGELHGQGFDDGTIQLQQKRAADLAQHAKELISNLELALVTARLDLRREKALLEVAEASYHSTTKPLSEQNGNRDESPSKHNGNNSKLRALETTRTELQNWIAETLARCEEPIPPVGDAGKMDPDDQGKRDRNGTISDSKIEDQYARYIAARKRLLNVLEVLKRPLPAPSPLPNTQSANRRSSSARPSLSSSGAVAPTRSASSLNPPSHLRHKSRISLTYTPKTAEFITGPPLSAIEATHIPARQHEKMLSMFVAHLDRQTHIQDLRSLEMLNRLSHESHLLPEHPIPSGLAVGANGREATPNLRGARLGDGNQKTAGENVTRESAQIERLLRAWAFANEAADSKLAEGVEKDVEEAERALRGAEGYIEEFSELDRMRREAVQGGRRES